MQNAKDALNHVEAELQNVGARLANEHSYLVRGWHQLEVAVKLGRLQGESTRSKDEASTTTMTTAHEGTLQEAEVADRQREATEAHEQELLA